MACHGQDTRTPQTFTVTVAIVNDAPVAVNDTAETNEDSGKRRASFPTGHLQTSTRERQNGP